MICPVKRPEVTLGVATNAQHSDQLVLQLKARPRHMWLSTALCAIHLVDLPQLFVWGSCGVICEENSTLSPKTALSVP